MFELLTPRTQTRHGVETVRSSPVARAPEPCQDRPGSGDLRLQRAVGNRGMMLLAHPAAPDSLAVAQSLPSARIMRTPVEPYVRQINVNLTSPQNVSVDWQGTAPADTRSSFRCSTGKGYGDPGDPPGICTRACCTSGTNPCASPNDRRRARGSCCTPVGDFVIQSKERDHAVEGGTIPFWMYFYRSRGIALHEYSPVDGTPLSHGCVRLDSANAEMLFNYSYADTTRVNVSGAATPACPAGSGVACTSSASAEPAGAAGERARLAEAEAEAGREEVDASA